MMGWACKYGQTDEIVNPLEWQPFERQGNRGKNYIKLHLTKMH